MASFKANLPFYRDNLAKIILGQKQISAEDMKDAGLFTVSHQEGVFGLLCHRLLHSQAGMDEVSKNQLQELLRQAQQQYLRLKHATAQVLSAMSRSGIEGVCMRGVAVAEPLYAGQAALRPISDIDLLLDERRMMDAKQALWDIGFRPDEKYRNIYARGDIMIDLHHEPLGIERINAWQYLTPLRAGDFFRFSEEGELAGEKALVVHPRVLLPYLCFHALKHSFERLIWLYDIALLASRVDAAGQWDEVLAGIHEYRLDRPCFYALSYVNAHLGASVPDELLENIRPEMGFVERRLFARHMNHEVIPYLAERLFARMQPDFRHRMEFWRETIWPRYEVRAQMVQTGCVKCNFIRKRIKQLAKASWLFIKEGFSLLRV